MKKTPTWMGLVALMAAASGCDAQVVGGGGGAGGAGSTGGEGGAATGTSGTTGEGASSGEGTGTGPPGSGATTGGGGNPLGTCQGDVDATVGATSGGMQSCSYSYTCDGGDVYVVCADDGTTEVCECYLNGAGTAECVEQNQANCAMPASCCYAALGEFVTEPHRGPYGACEPAGGTTSGATASGGETACVAGYTCDGGALNIGCSGNARGVECECRDGQGLLVGTCEQSTVDCDYASGCCKALVN